MWGLLFISTFVWGVGATINGFLLSDNRLCEFMWRFSEIGVTFISVFLLHMVFSLTKRYRRIILLFSYLQAVVFAILLIQGNLVTTNSFQKYYGYLLVTLPGKLYLLWVIIWLFIAAVAHFDLIKFYLEFKDNQKREIIYIFFVTMTGFVSGALNFFYFLNIPMMQIGNLGIAVYCILITYAIFRHQIMGIEIVFKKGLLYSTLIAIFTSIYLAVVFICEWLFRGIVGYKSFLLSLFSAIILAFLFNPLRDKIQSLLDRLFLGKTAQEIAVENDLLKQELEYSDRLKAAGTLALGLAHEIKNPLTTIKTFSEYLPEKHLDNEFIKKFSILIPAEVERINHIIHRLLDFSKPALPILKPNNIANTMKEIFELMSNDFLKRKIVLIEQYENYNLIANIDVAQIKQVFFNILINAMDSMPNGGNIYISTTPVNGEKIEIILKDEGSGISGENLKNIFNPFFTTKDEGTGLGLTICHKIIKNHSGSISIKSELGKGTTVAIRLPRAVVY